MDSLFKWKLEKTGFKVLYRNILENEKICFTQSSVRVYGLRYETINVTLGPNGKRCGKKETTKIKEGNRQ